MKFRKTILIVIPLLVVLSKTAFAKDEEETLYFYYLPEAHIEYVTDDGIPNGNDNMKIIAQIYTQDSVSIIQLNTYPVGIDRDLPNTVIVYESDLKRLYTYPNDAMEAIGGEGESLKVNRTT